MITREISENIECFEPRIELINIETIKDDRLFRLSFRIDCVLRNNGSPLKLFLDPIRDCYQVSA